MLYLETVSPALLKIVQTISAEQTLTPFRLVGGTALSLYLGHRESVDADFFCADEFDKRTISERLANILPGILNLHESPHGFAWVFENVKIDLYTWRMPFLLPAVESNGIRLAAIEDVAALKLDAIVQRKEEKDYRDAHALLSRFSLSRLLAIYHEHYPNNSSRIVVDHLAAVEHIPHDDSIRLLRPAPWELVVRDIQSAIKGYFSDLKDEYNERAAAKDRALRALLEQKKKRD